METLIIILLCLISAGLVASPFIAGREEWIILTTDRRLEKLKTDKEMFYQAIKDVDFEHAEGKLTDKDYHELRDYYKEKAIITVKAIEDLEARRAAKEVRS